MLLAWVVYPLVLVALGAGWGALIERASGAGVNDALLVPLGLAGVIVVAGTLIDIDMKARDYCRSLINAGDYHACKP